MKKQTVFKVIAIAAILGTGYYLWNKSKKKNFVNAAGGEEALGLSEEGDCPCKKVLFQQKGDDGRLYNICSDQSACPA